MVKEIEIDANVIGKIWRFLKTHSEKVILVYGGAGSGKSYTVAQFLILDRMLQKKNKRVLITRKTNPSLRESAWRLVKELLELYNIPYQESKSEQRIIVPSSGGEILFRGVDNPEKIKSTEFNYIWMEEATEFSLHDYNQLRLRLRRPTAGDRNQIYLTFNPIGKTNWVYKTFFKEPNDDVAILHTYYKDNPFLDEEYKQMLLKLRHEDKTFYKIYTLGEFAELENIVYYNYEIVDEIPEEFDEIIYGLDFGYNNPTALIKIGIKDDVYYIVDELYQTKLTNEDLIEKMKDFVDNRESYIFCDSAEPNRIEEISRAGFNAHPSVKDVKMGIDFVNRKKLKILSRCQNTIEEIQHYKWKEDRAGNVLDEPVKFNDHAMDAIRYAIYTYHKMHGNVGIDIISFKKE